LHLLHGVEAGLDHARGAIAALDLVLQQQEPVDHAFGAGRAARDVDVAGDDLVDPWQRGVVVVETAARRAGAERQDVLGLGHLLVDLLEDGRLPQEGLRAEDRKSTRLNSSHVKISYAVFCLKKKK